MARPPAQAHKASLYRLVRADGKPLRGYVQSKYLDRGFISSEISISGIDSLLVSGVIPNPVPKWTNHVQSLIGTRLDVHNDTSAALLLVPFGDYIYVVSWGFGHLIFDQSHVDPGFGLRFALRRANSNQVRSLTMHTMDTLARTARTTIPGGAAIGAFGMEEIGEILSRIVGRISTEGLTAANGNRSDVTIRGADGLSIPLGKEQGRLLADIRFLHGVVEYERPAEGLEHFEHTKPLRAGDPVLDELKLRLSEALVSSSERLALSWPATWEEEHGEADGFAIARPRSHEELPADEFTLELLTRPLAEKTVDARIGALNNIKITALDADGGAISQAIRGDRWITFETDVDGQRYVFHQGRWFNIGGAYLEMLRSKLEQVFARRSSIIFLPWLAERKEKGGLGPIEERSYNEHVQGKVEGFLCLDRKLLHTEQHPRGIEACDLLGPDDEIIHVKRIDGSTSASHLFNQAIVSAETLFRQADATEKFRKLVRDESGGSRELANDFRPTKIVLAFSGRPATVDGFMTFSQVTLARCAQRIAELEVLLEIAEIDSADELFEP